MCRMMSQLEEQHPNNKNLIKSVNLTNEAKMLNYFPLCRTCNCCIKYQKKTHFSFSSLTNGVINDYPLLCYQTS